MLVARAVFDSKTNAAMLFVFRVAHAAPSTSYACPKILHGLLVRLPKSPEEIHESLEEIGISLAANMNRSSIYIFS